VYFTFGCMKHRCHLSGQPEVVIKQERANVRVWQFDLSKMNCPGTQVAGAPANTGQGCVQSWRVSEA